MLFWYQFDIIHIVIDSFHLFILCQIVKFITSLPLS